MQKKQTHQLQFSADYNFFCFLKIIGYPKKKETNRQRTEVIKKKVYTGKNAL